MTNKLKKTCKARFVNGPVDSLTHALDLVLRDSHSRTNPIEEQLRQCPEAFKAGELLEKALSSLQYGQDEVSQDERWLPPAGSVVPPIV